MEEIWKDIEGYEGIYQVSSLGRVKSLSRTIMRSNGRPLILAEKIRKPFLNKFGYQAIILMDMYKVGNKLVHRLVATAFTPNMENKEDVNHINGVKYDNRAENLEWCTRSENVRHAFDVLGHKALSGEAHNKAKLTIEQVKKIKIDLRDKKDTQAGLAKKYGVNESTIGSIARGKNWKHVLI